MDTKLTGIFGIQQSPFHIRFNCLEITKSKLYDYVTFTGYINHECETFSLQTLTEDQFKCLIFIADFKSPNDWCAHMTIIQTGAGQKHNRESSHSRMWKTFMS